MQTYELLDDLYAYNTWANGKILAMSEQVTNAKLDAPLEMGFGSLRATLFHLLTAERVWMERWTGAPWRPFPRDPDGITLAEISSGLGEVAAQRRSLIELNRGSRWKESITYIDSKKNEHTSELYNQLIHVANHGVHHRAQALHFLKRYGQTVPAGLDYIFYRLAATTIEQPPKSVKALQDFGLEVGTLDVPDPIYDSVLVDRLFRHCDWANAEIITMCDTVEVAALDRNFDMGCGTIRKTLLHLMDAERWWIDNWNGKQGEFPHSAEDMKLTTIRDTWPAIAKKRSAFVKTINQQTAMDVVTIQPDGPPTSFRIGESAVHLALHATHHRAQIINMLRRSEGRIRDIDFLYAPSMSS
ncbi:DinB family protein [Stieleria sp. TO1_6]|uniref:DinB family protein n=1 Tax=Stieleria tagensis TaxID=2956795 RepID=UPI00209A8DAE|nr:DinB family protein [Stieleria tagensis]MCO8120800.1 DinB family protein [Stieleria tagensis]